MAVLNAQSFPPGSSRAFVDAILRQQQRVEETGKGNAQNGEALTKLQAAVNALSGDVERAEQSAASALSAAQGAQATADQALRNANSAGNGVGDINMNAVFKNETARQAIAGQLQAAAFLVGGNQVIGARQTGWTGGSGVTKQGGVNCDASYDASNVNGIIAGLVEVRKLAVALQIALSNHGLINS